MSNNLLLNLVRKELRNSKFVCQDCGISFRRYKYKRLTIVKTMCRTCLKLAQKKPIHQELQNKTDYVKLFKNYV